MNTPTIRLHADAGQWKLPPVRDLLPDHQPPQNNTIRIRNQSISSSPCTSCLARDRQVILRPGESCPYCCPPPEPVYERPGTTSFDHGQPSYILSTQGHSASFQHPASRTPRPSISPMAGGPAPPNYQPRTSGPNVYAPPTHPAYLSRQHFQQSAFPPGNQDPFRQRLPSSVSAASSGTNGAPALSAAKLASNDRHKLSEKHRRDGMGAFVQAGHALRSGISPGHITNCRVCLAESSSCPSQMPFPTPDSSFSGSTPPAYEPKSKIPKNDMLSDSLIWEFGIVLHMTPDKVLEHVERIQVLALQMQEEKMHGLATDAARKKKWSADVRGDVLLGVVAKMRASMRDHGIITEESLGERRMNWKDIVIGSPSTRVKREREEIDASEDEEDRYEKRRSAEVPTPPSSRASPIL